MVVNDQFVGIYLRSNPSVISHWFSVSSATEFEQRLQEAYSLKDIPPSQWHTVKYHEQAEPEGILRFIPTLGYMAILLLAVEMYMRQRRMGGGPGGGSNPFQMTQMKGAVVEKNLKIGFKDVAGVLCCVLLCFIVMGCDAMRCNAL